ncbi:unnamed protein product [Acanthoscelides obtectus]|uniref:FGFR1 oncogene partner (FOP) N-terminal dimerisation domain-containing protein n=1 Tax=Acanthoscelides obtectus TaxID=200917 RepID=A0A9P0PSV4_ACAOB|nr:unnamed protein product [Acanthoscelides obtectus]CAK1644106.1 LisH domain-containing protein FOPNL [Acanthoscelides obtectus]
MSDPTETDLLDAIKDSLEKNGTLGRLNGEVRTAIMNVLNQNFDQHDPPKVPDETRLINELLREYLAWNGYMYTEQVLAAESGHKGERMSRDVLTTKFGVMDDVKTARIPLLYYMVAAFQAGGED